MEDLVRLLVLGVATSALACSSTASSGGSGASGGQSTTTTSGGSSSGGAASGGATAVGGSNAGGALGAAGAGVGGSAGFSGLSSAGAAGSAGSAGSGGAPGGGVACPADATFCSGFEVATLPMGAVYKANAAPGDWTRDFAIDTSVVHSGSSSLRVKSSTETGVSGAYRMLAVPAPTAAFWARFYMQQTELDIGGVDHNVFAGASATDDPNSALVEFAEDVGVAFNTNDVVRWPLNYGRTTAGAENPFTLSKGRWYCIELAFDSQGREQKLFVDGAPLIDATDYPAASSVSAPFKIFKFGFNQLHGPTREVWYDDVAVGPTRAGCL